MDSPVAATCRPAPATARDCALREVVVRDVDEQAAGLRAWEQRYVQLTPGAFEGVLHEVCTPALQIFRESASQALHQSGCVWPGRIALGVPLAPAAPALLCGEPLQGDALAVVGSAELDLYAPRGFTILAVTLPRGTLHDYCARVERLDVPVRLLCNASLAVDPHPLRVLRDLLTAVLAACRSHPACLSHPHAQRFLEQSLVGVLLDVIGAGSAQPARTRASRRGVVARARRYMLERIDQPIGVADVCVAIGVSRRTLQYSFQEVLQINPVAFLRALRLDGVRRELKRARAAAPGGQARGCVQDVAAHWGFWHLGHFVADYRRMFGERPSETLRGRQPMVDGRRALA